MGESSATSEYVEAGVTIMDSDTGSDEPGQNGSDDPDNGSDNGDSGDGDDIKYPMGPNQG